MAYVGVKPAAITSTTEAEIAGDLTVDTNTLHVDAANNRIGIGTTSPARQLEIFDDGTAGQAVLALTAQNDENSRIMFADPDDNNIGILDYDHTNDVMKFIVNNAERGRWLSGGGLTFNGDTAAANALSDYEEGTWTGTLKGSSSDPSTAVTATGYYTKVGRLVNILIDFNNVNTTGASGTVSITGMPFSSGTGADTPANGNAAVYNFNIHSCNNMSVQVASSGIFIYCSRDQNTWVNATHLAGTGRYLGITATYFVN